MSTTLSLQATINFVTPILKNQPLLVSNFEPALTAANTVLGTILGPPFKWRFNRNSFNFAINATNTDYAQALPDFGFLETQWLIDSASKLHALGGAMSLPKDVAQARPTKMAPQYDDNGGNITFRFDRLPDQPYTVYGDYQKKARLMTSPASVWGVVPDEFSYIYNDGFMAMMMLLVNDSRFPIFENYFVSRLLGAQDGLSDQERDIFLGNWMRIVQTVTRSQGSANLGTAARGKQ
jgi:hypothetical protein